MDPEAEKLSKSMARGRDRRLRKHLLKAVYECRISPSGWASAPTLYQSADEIPSESERFEDERHCIGLLRDLVIKGLIEERQTTRKPCEAFSLLHLEYRILARGLSLHLESVPLDPDIDDGRI
jgi:hypothetical protein